MTIRAIRLEEETWNQLEELQKFELRSKKLILKRLVQDELAKYKVVKKNKVYNQMVVSK